jgi:hypothetical protein
LYFYPSLSSYNYCQTTWWVNTQEWWVNMTRIYNKPQTRLLLKTAYRVSRPKAGPSNYNEGQGLGKELGDNELTEISLSNGRVNVKINGCWVLYDAHYFADVINSTPEYNEAISMKDDLLNRP